jgi:hypothetical protein
MVVHENEHDLLKDTVYHSVVSLWSEFSDAYAAFDKHGPAQLLYDQQIWESLLEAFPLKHKCMQTVLLAREIGRLNGAAWGRNDMGLQLQERCQQPLRKSRQNPPSFQIHGLGRAHNQ